MNIVSDIAGQYEAFLRLLKQMPDDDVLCVGDMIDRGPESFKVLEWFEKNGQCILGNHEHMMLDAVDEGGYYRNGIWEMNGGGRTMGSFGVGSPGELSGHPLVEWVRTLPLFVKLDGALVTHSFVHPTQTLEEGCDLGKGYVDDDSQTDICILWNRNPPSPREDDNGNPIVQIVGHNSQWGLRKFTKDGRLLGLCLDDSRHKMLTGLHWPSMKVFQEDYDG